MKAQDPKSRRYGGAPMLGVCLTTNQRQKLQEQAALAGLTLSEYGGPQKEDGEQQHLVPTIRMR